MCRKAGCRGRRDLLCRKAGVWKVPATVNSASGTRISCTMMHLVHTCRHTRSALRVGEVDAQAVNLLGNSSAAHTMRHEDSSISRVVYRRAIAAFRPAAFP